MKGIFFHNSVGIIVPVFWWQSIHKSKQISHINPREILNYWTRINTMHDSQREGNKQHSDKIRIILDLFGILNPCH